jgi:DNA polymerase-3 subunit alpha
MGWVPLHVHSEYSTLDGAVRIKDYVKWAEKQGLPAVAVTDHGFLSAIPEFNKQAKGRVKPIFGMEAYVEPVTATGQKYHHLVILVKNQKGLKNLYKMSSTSFENMKGRFGIIKPEWLKEYGEGLIFLSACMQGELPFLLRTGQESQVGQFMDFMKGLDFFVELVDIGTKEQDELNVKLKDTADAFGLMTVATPDAHYFAEDRWWYPTFWASNRHTSEDYETRAAGMASMDLSLPSPEYMIEKYGKSAENTVLVADMIEDVNPCFDRHMMPRLSGEDLRALAEAGLKEKISRYRLPRQEYFERLDHELGIIENLGFNNYMLLVRDIVKTAREKGIYVGPGRGSAAGSLVAWAIDITAVDPIRHGLLFERFINPGRKGFPDIDIDIEHERREEVIENLKEKYGRDAVAGIVTFSQYKIRNSVWDVLRALFDKVEAGSDVEQFKKIVGEEIRAERDEETNVVVREFMDEEAIYERTKNIMPREKTEEILETAKKIVSLHKNLGRHAAGIVITPGNVEDFCPTARVSSGGEYVKITQFDMNGIDDVKLVKMDVLGLKNLTAVREVYETARKFDKTVERPETIYDYLNGAKNLSEDRVRRMWAMIYKKPDGIFQVSSWKAKQIISRIKPVNISEFCDIIALNRPGPLAKKLDEYYARHDVPEELDIPVLKEITKNTRNVLIYQEQVMETARKVAGYSLSEADDLRKAVGKKKPEEMNEQRKKFIEGSIKQGYTKKQAEDIFSTIEKFAGYAFNKSHSMAYSYLACVTAWQKANYTPLWAKAYLNMKRKNDKKEILGDHIDVVNELCPIFGPRLTKKDKTLGDAMGMRVLRQAGIDVSEKDSFLLKNSWAILFGLKDIYQVKNQVEKYADFPAPETLKELWESSVKHNMTKSIFAPLFSLGVFDETLASYGDPVLIRAVMMLDEGKGEIYEKIKQAVLEIMPRIRKTPEEKLAGNFPFLSLFLLMNSSKKYSEMTEEIVEMYAQQADEQRFFEDPVFRNRCISVVYETERQLLGDGLLVKWWDMAAETVKYRFACFADQVQFLRNSRKEEVARVLEEGFWTIGKVFKKDGKVKLSGRNGFAGRPVMFFVNDRSFEKGIWAVKLVLDGKYFRYVTHVPIVSGQLVETDSELYYKNDKMPERLKEYVQKINPGLRAISIS